MKKTCFLFFILISFALSSFSQTAANRNIFIEGGQVETEEQMDFFTSNFTMEAISAGYTVTENKEDAGYTFRFDVFPNLIYYDDGTFDYPSYDEDQYFVQVTFLQNPDDVELVSYNQPFTEIYEMYNYTQILFLKAVVFIPPPVIGVPPTDQSWRNQWLYLRASLDFPITFYQLKPDGLLYGKLIYNGEVGNLDFIFSPIDNRVIAAPGITLGIEFQFLDWMSVEPNFQIGWESMNDTNIITMAAGLSFKFPLKFIDNLILEPYANVVYPLSIPISIPEFSLSAPSKVFESFSLLGVGAGFQFGIKGAGTDIIFFDLSYTYFIGDAVIYNHLITHPKPLVIHFQRSVIRLGIGYKFGFFKR